MIICTKIQLFIIIIYKYINTFIYYALKVKNVFKRSKNKETNKTNEFCQNLFIANLY